MDQQKHIELHHTLGSLLEIKDAMVKQFGKEKTSNIFLGLSIESFMTQEQVETNLYLKQFSGYLAAQIRVFHDTL